MFDKIEKTNSYKSITVKILDLLQDPQRKVIKTMDGGQTANLTCAAAKGGCYGNNYGVSVYVYVSIYHTYHMSFYPFG